MIEPRGSDWIRARRDSLVADSTQRGSQFGRALSASIDEIVTAVLDEVGRDEIAVLALGSYARRELAPGSDVDILLVHRHRSDVANIADSLWYPLWDAGFVLGNVTRTAKECLKLADDDLTTLTSLLDARFVGGGAEGHARELVNSVRALAVRRRRTLVRELADAAVLRRLRPGLIAEMLEPNLKEGAGGLRDLHALTWAGWATGADGGLRALEESGVLRPDDRTSLTAAASTLLDVRVGLHRVTGGHSDLLALQEQDAVAAQLGFVDADALVRELAAAARRVAWISDDAWTRLQPRTKRGRRPDERVFAAGVVERDGRVGLERDATLDASLLLRVARVAAERGHAIDRDALVALRDVATPDWEAESRADFLGILRQGVRAIDVFEALDHEDLVTRILPEWTNVRFRPQRNAYHRFTVDRHLLETVAEAAALLDAADAPEADAVTALLHPSLLLLGALLHDIAKGHPGDHATVGAQWAGTIGARLGLSADLIDVLVWLVRDHLLMADTATRRDLSDPVTIRRFSDRVLTAERLRLLMLLTVADSRATGPAAWGSGKAALVRELYDRTIAHWSSDRSDGFEGATEMIELDALTGPGVAVRWTDLEDGRLRCIVGAPDRPGLLADVAGALALEGFDISAADGQTLPDGRAADLFVGTDRLHRLGDGDGRRRAAATIQGVLGGTISVADGLRDRRETYGRAPVDSVAPGNIRVRVAQDESDEATVVEVFAPDEIGLLATIASVFATQRLDVRLARVATTGEQAVDVFYVQDQGAKVSDGLRVAALRQALFAELQRD